MSEPSSSEEDFPSFIERAIASAIVTQDIERYLKPWHQRWGNFTPETLKRMLEGGNERERSFAIFAFRGMPLANQEKIALLRPFLQHPEHMARWASTISLGGIRDEYVFSSLQALLLDGFERKKDFLTLQEIEQQEEEQFHQQPKEFICDGWFNERRPGIAHMLGY